MACGGSRRQAGQSGGNQDLHQPQARIRLWRMISAGPPAAYEINSDARVFNFPQELQLAGQDNLHGHWPAERGPTRNRTSLDG